MASLKSTLNPKYRHGLTDKTNPSEHHQIYNTWMNMKARCLRKTNPKYKRYGARGITIYQPWLDIVNFYKWSLENGWMPNYSIDRIDNNGNYCPENCRWVSVSENSRKKALPS